MRKGGSYEHTMKRFKFLADLTQNSNTDKNNIKLITCHYKDIDNKLVDDCHQFKECSRVVNVHENLKCPEILQLIYERNLTVGY